MKPYIPLCCLCAIVACPLFAQSTNHLNNLPSSAKASASCDSAVLTSSQEAQDAALKRDQNLWACLTGSGFATPLC